MARRRIPHDGRDGTHVEKKERPENNAGITKENYLSWWGPERLVTAESVRGDSFEEKNQRLDRGNTPEERLKNDSSDKKRRRVGTCAIMV